MNKNVVAFGTSILMLCSTSFAFSDVSKDFWASSKIEKMHEAGVISGFLDGTFKPDDVVTREQAAAMLCKFFSLSQEGEVKNFEDIESGYWSENYSKIVSKYMSVYKNNGKTYFKPFEGITRIEVAKTIANIMSLDCSIVDEEVLNRFNDKAILSTEDSKVVSAIVKSGIMLGDNNGNFRPNSTMTRAEFCALMYNASMLKNNSKAVMTINGKDVSVEDFNLYLNLQKRVYESMYGSTIWEEEVDGRKLNDLVKDTIKEGIISDQLKLQKAEEMNLKIDEDIKKQIEEYVASEQGAEVCSYYGLTSAQLLKLNLDGALTTKLAEAVYEITDHTSHSHEDINKPVKETYFDSRHILFYTQGMTDEEAEVVKGKAQGVLNRALAGEDFVKLASEYSEDEGSKNNGGLYENIKTGTFVTEYEDTILSLKDGEICDKLIKTAYGYHIIKLEKLIETEREMTDDEKQAIISADLEELVREWINKAEVTVNEEIYKAL